MKTKAILAGFCWLACLNLLLAGESADDSKVDRLVKELGTANNEARKRAIAELAQLGTKARSAAASLTRLLESENAQLRVLSAFALFRIAPETKGLESVFREALGSRDQEVRAIAAIALAQMGPSEPATVPALVQTLADEEAQTAEFAAAALARMGQPAAVAALTEALGSRQSQRRELAAEALGKIGKPAEPAIPSLIKLLKDPDGRVCNEAAKALGSFAPERKELIPHLRDTMKTYGSNYVATSAAESLGRFGPEAVPVLLELLRDERSPGGYGTVWAFQAMGPRGVADLVRAMNDPKPDVRAGVLGGLVKIGQSAVPELAGLLDSDKVALRRGAAWALGILGRPAPTATAALVRAVKSEDAELREAAVFALSQMRCVAAVPAVREALRDGSERVRFEAKMALRVLDRQADAKVVLSPEAEPARLPKAGEVNRFVGHEDSLVCVAFLPDGRRVLSGSHDGTVRQWDVDTGDQRRCFRIQGSVQALALPSDARWVACGGVFQRVHLLDLTTGQEVQQFDHQGRVTALAVTSQGDRVLSGGLPHDLNPARTVRLWDVASGKEVRSFASPFGAVGTLAISGDCRRALCAGDFRTPPGPCVPSWRVWDLQTGDMVFERAAAEVGFGGEAVLSTDGRRVLAPDHAGRSLSLWDLDAGKELKQMPNRSHICSIAMSPDGTRGVAGRADGRIDVYDVQRGRLVTTFATHSGPIVALAFSPEGRCAVSGGTDRLVRLWQLPE